MENPDEELSDEEARDLERHEKYEASLVAMFTAEELEANTKRFLAMVGAL